MRLGYLPQDVHVEGGKPLLAFILDSIPGRASLDEDLATAEADLEALSAKATTAKPRRAHAGGSGRIADLHERVAHFDGEYSEHHAKRIMAGLGFKDSDHVRDMSEFSGGWKMRAVLSSLLFQQPDLLLLDEPTNHLDMPSVAWFSGFLKRYERAFVLISHDREFLNEQITSVVSYEPEGVRSYPGDYNSYKRQRDEERVLLENRARNLEREREHLEKFVDRFRSKATKAAQVQSRVKKLEKMETVELQGEHVSMSVRFPRTERSGKWRSRPKDLGKSYGGLEVLKGVNQHVQRRRACGPLGVNGAGKTTLLRMLAGETRGHLGQLRVRAQHQDRLLRAAPRRDAAPRRHRLRRGEVLREGRAAPADPLGAGRHAVRRARGGQAHRRAVRRRARPRGAGPAHDQPGQRAAHGRAHQPLGPRVQRAAGRGARHVRRNAAVRLAQPRLHPVAGHHHLDRGGRQRPQVPGQLRRVHGPAACSVTKRPWP
ncbi:MAG: ATP-binding cassette domain-containing protein [Sandaracinaceae bacterium]|nr:ATP-binding cassette domain-containing protein [Sandaracinaceae bacterium]